jgi:hypothetical protein
VVVDLEGDMYVANRAFGNQGSITKIAGALSGCIDRNKNGTIETSNDANNDGIIDVNSPAEFFGQNDECVLYTVAVGANDTYPRALTIDGKGNAYTSAPTRTRRRTSSTSPRPRRSSPRPTTCRAPPTASSSAATTSTPRRSAAGHARRPAHQLVTP